MEQTNEKNLAKIRKKNMKLYSIYRMLSVDIVFMYAIKFIFLTEVRGINASDIILSTSMFALFMAIFQIPATIIVNKLGYIKSAFLSNLTNVIYIILIIFSRNLVWLLIAEFISTITFSIKEIADPSLLDISIPKTSKKREIFSKIEGKGTSHYFYLDAITSVLSGFLYAINPYIPFICSALFATMACFLGLQFEDIEQNKLKENMENKFKDEIKDLIKALKTIVKSKRLRALILYSGLIWGFHCLFGDYKINILSDLGASSKIIGIIAAILGITSGIAAKKQQIVHNKFRNKSLTVIGLLSAISILISGLIVLLKLPNFILIIIVIICSMSNYASRAIYDVLMKRYLGNFASKELLPKIYSANSFGKNLIRAIIGIVGSITIGIFNKAYVATIIMGSVFVILMIAILIYMKPRVGVSLEKIQNAFKGEAERLGLETEDDVVEMIKEFRKNKKKD